MGDPNAPLKDVGAEGVKQVGKVLQNIVAQLSGQPTFLFGIAAMLLAIVGVIALALLPNLPTSLTWFPYALLVFSSILIGFAYLKTPPRSRRQQPDKTEDTTKQPLVEEVSWPQIKTVKSLASKLSKLSATQRQILRAISESNGIYVFQLSDRLRIEREELVYRCKNLERDELISISPLTDLLYDLPDGCKSLFEKKTIQEMLQS